MGRGMVGRLAMLGLGLCIGSAGAQADGVSLALDGFAATCIANQADFGKMTATAADLGWTAIPPAELKLVGPRAPPEASQGWRTAAPDFPPGVTIGLTAAHHNGKPVQTCTLFAQDIDGRAFETAMVERLKARRIAKDDDGVHETRVYDVKSAAVHLVVVLTLPMDQATTGFSAGAVAEGR